jgi:beta-glucanase (GH16 family)
VPGVRSGATAAAGAASPGPTGSAGRSSVTSGTAAAAPASAGQGQVTGPAGATGSTPDSKSGSGATGAPGATAAPTAPTAATGPAASGPTAPAGSTASTAASGPTGSTSADPGGPQPTGDPGEWRTIFDDEFVGTSLARSKWSTGWFDPSGISGPVGPATELECYDPSHVVVGGGELDLNLTSTPETCASGGGSLHMPYTSAIVTTNGKFSFTYGFVEARIWLPGSGAIADWPAFWAEGQTWPTDGELDVVEGINGYANWHFHDPAGAPGGFSQGQYAGGWHTFGADWEPGSVTWYYDGENVGATTMGITSSPMYLILDLAIDRVNSGPLEAPATMRVSYVRVWQH